MADHAAETPAGNPIGLPMPIAPVVACVILIKAVLIHKVGVLDAAPAAVVGFTVTITVNVDPIQLPVVGVTV